MEVLAACHMHSEWSYDGSWSLDRLRDKFDRRGCRILMMTEHDRGFSASRWEQYRAACAAASSESVLVMPGIEYSDAANCTHILVWGNIPFLGEGLPTSQVLEAVRACDGVAVLAHPGRKQAWKRFEPGWADKLLGIEVWNRKYDGWAPGEVAPNLQRSANAIPFVGLDFHSARQSFPLAMVLEINSEVTEDSVIQCLRSRRCRGQAFGLPLTDNRIRKSLSILKMAEWARRRTASFVRTGRLFPVGPHA
jgi:hypothetical protein